MAGVADLAGNRLDGEWSNPSTFAQTGTSVFPSGNGNAGGDFSFRLNLLPGDVNQNGGVQTNDSLQVRSRLGKTVATAGYSPFADINGNGGIQTNDSLFVSSALAKTLPGGEPLAGVFASSSLTANSLLTADESLLISDRGLLA